MPISKLSSVSRAELIELYQEKRLTTQEIGERFGVSGETVRYHLVRLGIPRRGKPWAPDAARAQLECEQLRRLYVVDGLSMAAIGLKLGVGQTTVWARMRKCDIESRDLSSATIRYPRHDFSGNLVEKA